MENCMKTFQRIGGLAAILALYVGAAHGHEQAEPGDPNPVADSVRIANDRFKDVSVALSEGNAPIPCASGANGGAMGIHYVNPDYLKDDAINLAQPEAVMYEPMADGKLALIAVEYITSKGPAELQGHLFNSTARRTATALAPSTSCTCGPGRRTGPALSRT
jgi:hypothetical protein